MAAGDCYSRSLQMPSNYSTTEQVSMCNTVQEKRTTRQAIKGTPSVIVTKHRTQTHYHK